MEREIIIDDCKERIIQLKERANELLNDNSTDKGDYKAFFSYHDEVRQDALEEFEGDTECYDFFDKLPLLEKESNINLTLTEQIKALFSSSKSLKLKMERIMKNMIENYNKVLDQLDSLAA